VEETVMKRLHLLSAALVGAAIALGAGTLRLSAQEDLASDDAQRQDDVPWSPGAVRGIEEPLHWSASAHFSQGNEIVLTRFLRIHTPQGRTYDAKMFLVEFRPERFQAKEEHREAMKKAVARVVCWAYEIEADEGYQPDYVVPARYVQQTSATSYRVSLGMLTCDVRLVQRDTK